MKKSYRLLSLDVGFSSCKALIRDTTGELRFEKLYSSIARLPEKPIEMDDDQVFCFNGDYYIVWFFFYYIFCHFY